MKRFLAFILMIIVAVAAFTPCCTTDDCQDEITAAAPADHNKEDDGGGCSPFFSCTTCPGFTSMEKLITVPVVLPEYHPQQYFIASPGNILSTYANAPWQPPRFV